MESGMRIDICNTAKPCLNRALGGISYWALAALYTPTEATARISLPLILPGAQHFK